MTTVLPLSAGSTMISVSLFRSWRANRSCLVMFGEGGLALERILIICGYYLLVLMGVGRWLTLFGNLFLWNLSKCHCEVRVFSNYFHYFIIISIIFIILLLYLYYFYFCIIIFFIIFIYFDFISFL